MLKPIKNTVAQVMEDVTTRVNSVSGGKSENDEFNGLNAAVRVKAKNPLLENGFTPIPRVLDDLAIELGKNSDTRQLARALPLVVLDLARHTDTANGDVIVTNSGVAGRRGIGLPAVKATIKLLLKLNIVRKEEPSFERRLELQRVPGGFSGNRRYLVWNPQSRWKLPETEEDFDVIGLYWNEAYKSANRADSKGYP